MAKPYGEISKTEFDKTYNVVEVYTDINSIIAMLKTFNPKTQAIALGQKKKPRDTMPQWFKQWNDEVYEKKQPQWFKTWTEEVYEKRQPQWFKTWEKDFRKELREFAKINDLKLDQRFKEFAKLNDLKLDQRFKEFAKLNDLKYK